MENVTDAVYILLLDRRWLLVTGHLPEAPGSRVVIYSVRLRFDEKHESIRQRVCIAVAALPGSLSFPLLSSIPPLWSILSDLYSPYFPAYDLVNRNLWQNLSRLELKT